MKRSDSNASFLGEMIAPVRRVKEFPVCAEVNFLAHAGVAPLPGVAVTAIGQEAERAARFGQEPPRFLQVVEETRASLAMLGNAKAKEIALLGPTALGLNLVAWGLDWEEGDEVIYYPDDYPANVYPWLELRRKGVQAVPLEPAYAGEITADLVRQALTARTRLVALASCHYLTGYRIDIAQIGEMCRRQKILFCLDAIQSLGATQVDLQAVDFAAADSHKWMLGPNGAGIFFVRENVQNQLHPLLVGAWNVMSPEFVAQDDVEFCEGAARFECGSLNSVGNVGMRASAEMLGEIGIGTIEKRLLHLRRYTLNQLGPLANRVCFAMESDSNVSGIISIRFEKEETGSADAIFRTMRDEGVYVSLRKDRKGNAFIRLSPHFYNTEEELDQAVEIITETKEGALAAC